MQVNTLDFNSKNGEVIPIDDVNEEAVTQYFLNDEESRLKETIWKSQNADYLQRQKLLKKRNQKLEEKRRIKRGVIS